MFTADDARAIRLDDLDLRIRNAVKAGVGNSAYMRITDSDRFNIKEELEKRGFINVTVPEFFVLSADVYFQWE